MPFFLGGHHRCRNTSRQFLHGPTEVQKKLEKKIQVTKQTTKEIVVEVDNTPGVNTINTKDKLYIIDKLHNEIDTSSWNNIPPGVVSCIHDTVTALRDLKLFVMNNDRAFKVFMTTT